MYTEEYEQRGFPFRDFLLKLILIIIFIFLLVWLLPKFISPKVVNKNSDKTIENKALSSQIFAENINKMKEAAISYYTEERLPKEVGESEKMTLSEMIGKKLLVPLIDKNGKACNVEKSYVKITKMDNEFLLKVNLKTSTEEDYILVHLGCYNYCDSYICEKNETNVNIKESKPSSTVVINTPIPTKTLDVSPTPTSTPSETPTPTDTPEPTNKPTPSPTPTDTPTPTPTPTNKPNYVYKYQKTTKAVFTSWTGWSNWAKTSCSTQAINCNDSDETCLKKLQRFDNVEQIGTYQKAYVKPKSSIVQTGSYNQLSCSNYNYIIINNTTYATKTNYTTVNNITSNTQSSIGNWKYIGRYEFSNPPRDSATVHYEFVGANYSYCKETCTTLPNYYYDKYELSGSIKSVSSTTTPITTTSSSISASCGSYITKTIPIYSTITTYDKAYRTEPLYGTVCYQSIKTRKIKTPSKTYTKWSKYNDKSLLENDWKYTGESRPNDK